MACPHNQEMVWVGGRFWWFPGSRIDAESTFKWRDNMPYFLEPDGSAVAGTMFVGESGPIDALRCERGATSGIPATFLEGREMEKPMKAGPNQMQWGAHLVKMTIFFDNVFRIPPSSQGGKFCIACDSQATFVKLDGDGEPLGYLCAEHVVEARR